MENEKLNYETNKYDSISYSNRSLRRTFLIVFTLTAVISIILFIYLTGEHKKNIEVSEIGIETTAEYYDYDMTSHTDDDGHTSYSYYLKYRFKDTDNVFHIKKDSIGYSYPPTNKLGSKFAIKYHPTTFRVVKLPFDITKDFFSSNIVSFVFTGVSIIFLVIFIVYFLKAKADIELENNGTIYKATFLSFDKYNASLALNKNKIGHYRIVYTWEENGVKKDSTSDYIYRLEEAKVFERLNKFEIYVLGEKTAIKLSKRHLKELYQQMIDEEFGSPTSDNVSMEQQPSTEQPSTTTQQNNDTSDSIICKHCGATLPSHAKFCNKCGAPQE